MQVTQHGLGDLSYMSDLYVVSWPSPASIHFSQNIEQGHRVMCGAFAAGFSG